jgi:type III secretion protein J
MRASTKRFLKTSFALTIAIALGACKTELYSGVEEREANEMIAALSEAKISASRESSADGQYDVMVDGADVATATQILTRNGLPRGKFETLGKIFESSGMVATPFEERARYMYAVDQELARSISQVAGVSSARVHVTIPEETPFQTERPQPRASVFIYYTSKSDVQTQLATIKKLVVNAVNGLEYENVEVAMFPIAASESAAPTSGGFSLVRILIVLAGFAGLALWLTRTRATPPKARRIISEGGAQ